MKKRNLRVSMVSIGVFAAVLGLVATTSVALAGRWGGHQTGGGAATVLTPPLAFVAVSPAPGTSISFGIEAKADSLVPALPVTPQAPAGTLEAAPGATIQGHATWIDHSTSPPRMIRLTDPVGYRCHPLTGQGVLRGWGTDSSVAGRVFLLFRTFDGQAPAGPPDDQVLVRVWLAQPPPPPAVQPTGIYWANATVSGEVVQHSCHQ